MQSLENSSQISKQTSWEELGGEKVSIQLRSTKCKSFEIRGEVVGSSYLCFNQVLTAAHSSQSHKQAVQSIVHLQAVLVPVPTEQLTTVSPQNERVPWMG